ncbi:MAG: FtsB family cell division protein [Gaiellaceae bacterium]
MAASKKTKRRRSTRGIRLLVLGVVAFAAFLYYQPLASYFDRREELAQRSKEVAALRIRKQELERRLEASKSPAELAREARRLGLVKEGEHLFIVKGVDAWKRARGATIDRGER